MTNSICFIAGGLAGGGQERALTNLANEFARRGNKITIICLFKTEIFFDIHQDIQVIWPTVNRSKTNKFVYAVKLIPYIRIHIKQISPDMIVSFGDWFNAYSILATRFLNLPVYIANRMGPNLHFGKLIEFFNRMTYKSATAMIVQTNRAKEIMQKKYGLKDIRVIPNAVMPIDLTNRTHDKVIITVGRLSAEKGHAILIHAFSKINDINWKLDIVGNGPERDSLEKLVSNLGLEKRVCFHGHQKVFKDLLSKASIFVLPSFYEGFPNALVEAMSVPIACVASDCIAGPGEIITHGKNGFLFEPGNIQSLATILNDLTSNFIKIREVEQNAYMVRETYDFQRISSAFLNEIKN